MPHPELKLLGNYADVRIHKAFLAEEYVPLNSVLSYPAPKIEPVDYVSISSGLFYQSYIASLSTQNLSNIPGRPAISCRSAWLVSSSRAKVFQEVVNLSLAGFKVISFGIDSVSVAVKKSEIKQFKEHILQSNNLMLPAKFA